jgi:hypothetical protein
MAASRQMAGVALYAALFVPSVARLDLHSPTQSHRDGPYFLNVLRYLDMPQAVALAAQNTRVVIYQDRPGGWEYPAGVIQKLRWDAKQLELRRPAAGE